MRFRIFGQVVGSGLTGVGRPWPDLRNDANLFANKFDRASGDGEGPQGVQRRLHPGYQGRATRRGAGVADRRYHGQRLLSLLNENESARSLTVKVNGRTVTPSKELVSSKANSSSTVHLSGLSHAIYVLP
jgi:hypothetical protein